jgi:hypothetical protein
MDKSRILEEIKRLASIGGEPPGMRRFERETGIRKREWYPTYWLRWGDALQEAGFSPNKLQTAFGNDFLLERYIALIREIGHFPVDGELELKSKSDPSFPNRSTFSRFGGKAKLVAAVQQYCEAHDGFEDVVALCQDLSGGPRVAAKGVGGKAQKLTTGFVYLMKSGRHFKIGRTKSLGRREWELGIKIPVPPTTVHSIETDDPVGVEEYWHQRFSEKRGEGEWFNLSPDDIDAFKRWKRIA